MKSLKSFSFLLLIFFLLIACGSSESDNSESFGEPDTPPQNDTPNNDDQTDDNQNNGDNQGGETLESAARFLSMATLGADFEEIEKVSSIGKEKWLEEQFEKPAGLTLPFTLELMAQAKQNGADTFAGNFRRYSWWQEVMTSPDLLRQRIALAFSEIFVVSDKVDILGSRPEALASYYDLLLTHAFGNFREMLMAVTLHPAMGIYLSHLNNKKADPEKGTFPDENYAREVMQLFTIGLHMLNPDGTEMKDSSGKLIPTYDNDDIAEFARVFTGLKSAEQRPEFEDLWLNLIDPMIMNENQHDTGEKTLLNGTVLPAGQSGMKDISDAIDNLFYHPNTGPFICKQLIKRLVTSNPSPAYVQRIAEVFADNGFGVRGDMKAVIKAILLDPEATNPSEIHNPRFGKFHEPWIRYVALLRAFNATTPNGYYFNTGRITEYLLHQHPLSSPSVFNFFLPNFTPNGIIGENNLTAPEFQIITSSTIVNYPNMTFFMLFEERLMSLPPEEDFFLPVYDATLDLSDELNLADKPEKLIERLDILLTYGSMSEGTKQIIIDAVSQLDDPLLRVKMALYLTLISPDYVVQN